LEITHRYLQNFLYINGVTTVNVQSGQTAWGQYSIILGSVVSEILQQDGLAGSGTAGDEDVSAGMPHHLKGTLELVVQVEMGSLPFNSGILERLYSTGGEYKST
jgi:hypothetical protein